MAEPGGVEPGVHDPDDGLDVIGPDLEETECCQIQPRVRGTM